MIEEEIKQIDVILIGILDSEDKELRHMFNDYFFKMIYYTGKLKSIRASNKEIYNMVKELLDARRKSYEIQLKGLEEALVCFQ